MKLNSHLQPEDAPITTSHKGHISAYQLDSTNERGNISNSQIKDQSVTTDKLSGSAIGSTNISDGAVTEDKLASFAVGSTKVGTNAIRNVNINDFAFSKGTGPITVTSGTLSSVLIGTSTITGGTCNPAVYNVNGTAGATGTVIYVGSVDFSGTTTTLGTIIFHKGLVTSIT